MYAKTALTLLSASLVAQVAADAAPPTTGNPPSVIYEAKIDKVFFADAALPGQLKGSIIAQAPSDGKGVQFQVSLENLPTEGGPFSMSQSFS